MVKMALPLTWYLKANGGMSTETKQFYRRLSQMLCEKSDVSYSDNSA